MESNSTTSMDNGLNYSCMFTDTFYYVTLPIISLVIVSTVFGNVILLCSLYKFSVFLTGSWYIFIGNMAVADLLLALSLLLYPLENIFPEVAQNTYFCTMRLVFILMSLLISGMTLMMMSVDRFMAVIFPMKHLIRTTKKKLFYFALICVWAGDIPIACIPLYNAHTYGYEHTDVCRNGAMFTPVLNIIVPCMVFFQFMFNTSMYIVVVCRLTRSRRKFVSSNTKRRNIIKSTKFKLTVLVFAGYVVCWFPFAILSLLLQISHSLDRTQVLCAREYSGLLGIANSGMNWIIYGCANVKLRQAFKATLCCKNKVDVKRKTKTIAATISSD